ncbi:Subtilisin-like protease [Morella rubra]|uniref:Subtilisin-like protease n=1 Tax=Morella rubra TaxID=262757 RepID=A0A6A1V945_9ROSI|nr:Subtilisin-like protease [Morella rubra]
MGPSVLPLLLLSFSIFLLLHTPIHGAQKSYIVYMGAYSSALEPTEADLESVTNSHYNLLGSYLGSTEKAESAIFYSYQRYINGFAATLDEKQASEIANAPNVVSVFENTGRNLHTTRSWDFLGLERDEQILDQSLWNKAKFGEDVIIGNLDTGVWPESKSFSDEGLGPIPSKWKGYCQSDNKDGVHCNRKLIGARYFNKGYAAAARTVGVKINETFFTARDHSGHGSHTLSTAGGSFVPGTNVFGYGNGTAKGGSPKARVAAYKVCWPPLNSSECFDADVIAGIEAAISDGVDVISMSLGGKPVDFLRDMLAIGSFHAVKNGVTVISSAGNDGPEPATVSNVAPWILTVGASTMDREFASYVSLGNKRQFKGTSLSTGGLASSPLVSAADARTSNVSGADSELCLPGTLDPSKVKGKIVVCIRGQSARVSKGLQVILAGGVGMILANNRLNGNGLSADPHLLPTSHISYDDGQLVLAYISSTKNPEASISTVKTELGIEPAPIMASFSSRGPSTVEPEILKPDITAPGVNVIAAFSEATSPSELDFDKRRSSYMTMSGTSMSCPHISGIVALLKAVHPQWSPAALRSAIMTTAKTRDNNQTTMLDATNLKATPLAYGAGHVQPKLAVDPGLIYDLLVEDYLNFLCARGYSASSITIFTDQPYKCPKGFHLVDFNYPSIAVPYFQETPVTVTRTVTNVGSPGSYDARIKAPAGVSVAVEPETLEFKAIGEKKTYKLTLTPRAGYNITNYEFGELIWSDGKHFVRSTIAVSSGQKKNITSY